jgi:predicted TIM-barrel fold metal-dependent hydrolase
MTALPLTDTASNAAWLAQRQEEALEPRLPICDPHHHLWDFQHQRVQPRYFLDDILCDIAGGHNVVSSVFIECGAMFKAGGPEALRPIGETEFVNGIAAMSASGGYGRPRIAAGIVGTAYLTLGDAVGRVLDSQMVAGGGRFRGIRQAASYHPSAEIPDHRTAPGPSLYAREDFRAGFAQLAPRGLSFEAWCYHTQLGELVDLARAFPDTTIILDHFGGPLGIGPYRGKADEVYRSWKKDVTELARCANVYAKLGGLAMDVNGFDWHLRDTPPGSEEFMAPQQRYFDTTLELFGAQRCMFESNFPVDKLSVSYTVLWNAFKRYSQSFSAEERACLFHDTAARVYRLDVPLG